MLQKTFAASAFLIVITSLPALAQFNVDGQYIVRSEYRNGYNRLIPKGTDPAAFIAHRARLQANYTIDAFTFNASIQDIRTWGNAPQTKITDNNLSVHEAWVEGKISEKWKVKLGRQELNYDNARFLGNLDRSLQGRAHDFALVKYEAGNTKIHFGGGYNQDAQQIAGNLFTLSNQYKAAQMVRLENSWGKFQLSALLWNDGRQYTTTNSLGTVLDKGVRYKQTVALPTIRYQFSNTTLSGFYYHQLGRDPQGRKVDAFDVSAQVTQQFNFDTSAARKLRITAGLEILSGTSTNNTTTNRSFSPMYGTNHAHNGYMDLFYLLGAHENNVGLQDYYLRTRYDFSPKFFTQIDGHAFATHANVYRNTIQRLDKYLGTEVDLTLGYLVSSSVSLQGGYSQFFYANTFETIQNNFNPKIFQNWAYLMLIFRPTIKNKFIGVLL